MVRIIFRLLALITFILSLVLLLPLILIELSIRILLSFLIALLWVFTGTIPFDPWGGTNCHDLIAFYLFEIPYYFYDKSRTYNFTL